MQKLTTASASLMQNFQEFYKLTPLQYANSGKLRENFSNRRSSKASVLKIVYDNCRV